jgi:hypothetical protein
MHAAKLLSLKHPLPEMTPTRGTLAVDHNKKESSIAEMRKEAHQRIYAVVGMHEAILYSFFTVRLAMAGMVNLSRLEMEEVDANARGTFAGVNF